VLKALVSRAGKRRAGKALARMSGAYGRNHFSALASVLFRKPGDLYLELTGPFGRIGLRLWLVEKTLTVLLPRGKKFLSEPATPEAAERLFGVGLYPEEILSLFLGEGIPLERYQPDGALPVGEGKAVRAVLYSGEFSREAVLVIDRAPARVLEGTLQARAQKTPLASFRYEYAGDSEFPRVIELRVPAESLRIRVTYKYFRIGQEKIRSGSFHVKIPKDLARVEGEQLSNDGPILFSLFKE
jgi:hypothetical protein